MYVPKRICSKCHVEKMMLEYYRTRAGHMYRCRQCLSLERKGKSEREIVARNSAYMPYNADGNMVRGFYK